MKYQWEDEQWYLAHKSRWDALPRTTPQEVHEELLGRCEYHAAAYETVASR